MNPARRATPDSEAVASSEDERPWPSSTSFGQFAMKENSMPGLPGGIWSTGKRGSFKLDGAPRTAARDAARLGAMMNPAHAALRGTPSPATSEGASLPFAIPLQPTPKTGRSLSHSQGQREAPQPSGAPHASGGGAGPALRLGLLAEAEEADTESESDMGSRLTHTTSHPPIGSLMRPATLSYDHPGASNGRDYRGERSPPPHLGPMRGKTFESAFQNLSLDQPRNRAQWQSHLGWDDVPNVNESRRHSLADIPTRRGSLAAGEPSGLMRSFTHEDIEEEQAHYSSFGPDRPLDTANDAMRAPESASINVVPPMYRVPVVKLTKDEQNEIDARRPQQAVANVQWGPGAGRPRKQLYVVSFKCSRVDVFYLLDNTGLLIREGDMVIVEADRGQDLGTVQHAKVTPDAARLLKKKYSEEQYKWLMMYSRNKDGGFNPNAQFHGESNAVSNNLFPDAPPTMQGSIPRDNYNNLKPKAIKRLANDHEIKMLAEKEGNEAKAKRTCQQKVAHLRLQMEILDAEWQWDFQKLIFYYYADHYINFKDLITELYRIYKTRIWLSAINPASFSQHAMGQPPTGIGPGAVGPYNPYAVNNNYTMAYGEDRDPYGAQMPYRIPYDTYNPNYPAIPGVANSFAPGFPPGQNYMFYSSQGGPPAQDDATPTAEPNVPTSGAMADYNFFYDRTGNNEHQDVDRMHPEVALRQSLDNTGQGFNRLNSSFGALSMGDATMPWNNRAFGAANNNGGAGMSQQAPIGTARPMSQGNNNNDYGMPTEEQRQHASLDFRATQFRNLDPKQRVFPRPGVLNDSGNVNASGQSTHDRMFEGLRRMDGGEAEQVASRVHNVDRYLATLPTPAEMRTDEMVRER